MAVLKRDSQYHTYADYLVWSRTYGDELIDGSMGAGRAVLRCHC
jgi:hypothetical protein